MKKYEPVILTPEGLKIYNEGNNYPQLYTAEKNHAFELLEDLKDGDLFARIIPINVVHDKSVENEPFKRAIDRRYVRRYSSGDLSSDQQQLDLISWNKKLKERCFKDLVKYCDNQNKSRISGKRKDCAHGKELELFVLNWEEKN